MNLREMLSAARAAGAFQAVVGEIRFVPEAITPLYIAMIYDSDPRTTLVIAPTREAADTLAADVASFLEKDILVLPPRGGGLTGQVDTETSGMRAAALNELIREDTAFVVTAAEASVEPLPPPRVGQELAKRLAIGDERGLDTVMQGLAAFGFERVYEVQNRGEFSVRGGIMDIFGPGLPQPVRLEFDDERIASIRFFSLVDQLSTAPADEAVIYSARDEEGTGATLLDYLPRGATVILNEPAAYPPGLKLKPREGAITVSSLAADETGILAAPHPVFWGEGTGADFDLVRKHIESLKSRGIKVVAALDDRGRVERFGELLREWGISEGIDLVTATVSHGFILPAEKLALITETDMFGVKRELRQKRQTKSRAFFDVMDLTEGDYVVHVYHGIGIYAGLARKTVDGLQRDFLQIEYARGDKLYIPTDQLGLIQRYIGGEGTAPRVERLGSGHWYRVKKKVKESTAKLAAELVELYAARKEAEGFAFAQDTPWQRELEESFPFIETPDQETAIQEVKADMEEPHPMDRLICGDVGYGKTEVAVRAAFKAVMDGKQVAILVPTTLLAEQHYETFKERYESFPVSLTHLSRLRGQVEQDEIVRGLSDGSVDIVVGTHRLLQADINFKNLGLFIIDEEQRFGVRHKEFLKKLRLNVDVLTLSATPIPRTLNMALTGARDMSVIDTAPEDRFPVATVVKEYDEALIAAAIEQELNRDGQVFFVHNRVESIDYIAARLRRLAPKARIAVSHGQMAERALEKVMVDFAEKRFDILVSTTIIESGLDMPNVNTLIVDRADKLGLSQLYQLRGRVGRSDRQAYAVFLYPPHTPLKPVQLRRLKTIAEFTDLGSGFRVALRDLEIRGAGNILGGEQHGFMNEVGFEMYASLLQEAVAKLKGEPVVKHAEVKINVPIEAYLPEEYISEEPSRIDAYKKIALAGTEDDVDKLGMELKDRYGELPEAVDNLLAVARLKAIAGQADVNRIIQERNRVRISPVVRSPGLDRVLIEYSEVAKHKESERALYIRTPLGRAGVTLLAQVLYAIMTDVFDQDISQGGNV